jgi:hypothetical protein
VDLYAGWMEPENQADERAAAERAGADAMSNESPVAAPDAEAEASSAAAAATGAEAAMTVWPEAAPVAAPAPPAISRPRALWIWFALLVVLGVGGVLLDQQELAALVAFAGLFIAAQAADVDSRWFGLYAALGWVVPVGGAAALAMLAGSILGGPDPLPVRIGAGALAIAGAAISMLSFIPEVARALVRTLFRTRADSHALHLAARSVLLVLLMAIPGALVFPQLIDSMLSAQGGLIRVAGLGGQLLGYVVLALATVGFLVRRDLRQTLVRLGIRAPKWSDLGLVAASAGALFLFNGLCDWIQHHYFVAGWLRDRSVNEQIAHGLGTPQVLLLGLSAGVGEEITLRGALQPKLGVVLTAALFASLHVQYSPFGMATIFAVGLILGEMRRRFGTSVAIGTHALYDMLAVFTV